MRALYDEYGESKSGAVYVKIIRPVERTEVLSRQRRRSAGWCTWVRKTPSDTAFAAALLGPPPRVNFCG